MTKGIFSLGHSNLSFEQFSQLLRSAGVDAVADVRSSPFSKQSPWFNRYELQPELKSLNIAYVFLGEELGGRPKTPNLFEKGVANYLAMSKTPLFKTGLERLVEGARKYSVAILCSEKDPLHCHRCLLVGKQLKTTGLSITHIHHDGSRETQEQAEKRLLREEGLSEEDFIFPEQERLEEAYLRRNRQVAFSIEETSETTERKWLSK